MPRFHWGLKLGLGLWLPLVVGGTAHADEKLRIRLDYRVASGLDCPSEREFKSDLTARLDRDPFVEPTLKTVQVTIELTDRGTVGQVSWRDERGQLPGERRFEAQGGSCRELAQNIAFSVAVQIQLLASLNRESADADPTRTEATSQRALPRSAEAVSPNRPLVTPPDSMQQRDAAPSFPPLAPPAPYLVAGAGLLAILGWSPDPSLGARVFAASRGRPFSVEASLELSAPTRLERRDDSGFEISAWSGTLAPCVGLEWILGCGVLRLGRVQADGFGVDDPRSPAGLLAQAGLRLAFVQALGERLEASVHAEAVGNLTPWRVELNQTEVWSAPTFAELIGLTLGASFR